MVCSRFLFKCLIYLLSSEEVPQIKVPVGWDQLTREQQQWTKLLRSGVHTDVERFDNLSPMIDKFYHTIQDSLEVNLKNMGIFISVPLSNCESCI